jgi:predicted nucleic acid-binding protein
MDIYAESNFVLELALLQEQHESCEKILALSTSGNSRLIIPAYCLMEPYETVARYGRTRADLSNKLAIEAKQLSRSKPYYPNQEALDQVSNLLMRSREEEKQRVGDTVNRIMKAAEIIDMTGDILAMAKRYEITPGLSPQDAVVYASVLAHLDLSKSVSSCFLNRNSKDFDDPDIQETLDGKGCKMLFSFDHGLGYVSSKIVMRN